MVKPLAVFILGLIFVAVGIAFYGMASDLSQVGPIKVTPGEMDTSAVAVAASSGFKAYVADKLTLAGEILIGVSSYCWLRNSHGLGGT